MIESSQQEAFNDGRWERGGERSEDSESGGERSGSPSSLLRLSFIFHFHSSSFHQVSLPCYPRRKPFFDEIKLFPISQPRIRHAGVDDG